VSQEIAVFDRVFTGIAAPVVAASVDDGPFASKITKTAGSPSVAGASASGSQNGGLALVLDATNEVQNACFYMGDILPFNLANLVQLDLWVSLSATINAAISAAWGLASARNDAIATIAQRALFRAVGSNELLAESADGTNTQASADTGLAIGTTMIRTTIGFKEGILTQGPPNLSTGGLSNLIYSAENGRGQLRRVCANKQFNVSAGSGGMQLFAQIQKTAAAAGATLTLYRARVAFRVGPNP
jgi:hypothetical protein